MLSHVLSVQPYATTMDGERHRQDSPSRQERQSRRHLSAVRSLTVSAMHEHVALKHESTKLHLVSLRLSPSLRLCREVRCPRPPSFGLRPGPYSTSYVAYVHSPGATWSASFWSRCSQRPQTQVPRLPRSHRARRRPHAINQCNMRLFNSA